MDVTTVTLPNRATKARRIWWASVARFLLTVLALVPYALGWGAGTVAAAAMWTWDAVVIGWQDARQRGGSR